MKGGIAPPKTFTAQQAVREATKCLSCHDAPCGGACPACVDVMAFVRKIRTRDYLGASNMIFTNNPLGATCARVCPTEEQCMGECQMSGLDGPVNISALQQFAADYGLAKGLRQRTPPATGKRVAVIGAGPAGLTAAAYLARLGHEVEIFEKEQEPGGMLSHGIPDFRLPKNVVAAEMAAIESLGVTITTARGLDADHDLDALMRGFDAAFIGIGSYHPMSLGIEGEDLDGVMQSQELLRLAAAGKPPAIGKNVLVFGGGNTAIDAATTALQLGAERVTVVYRRGFNEMPAWGRDIDFAREEKVDFLNLKAPKCFVGEGGRITGVECLDMRLGEKDASGRRSPVPIEGSEHLLEADTIIIAIGQMPDPNMGALLPGVEHDDRGLVKVIPDTGMTSRRGVFAGGDIVNGGKTVARAVADAKVAAAGIHAYLGSPQTSLDGCGFPALEDAVDDKDISVEFCGIRFPNPFVLSSAPPTTNGEMIMRAFEAGWGGAVTKTIGPAKIPVENVSPRLASLQVGDRNAASLVNIELISQYKPDKWLAEIREIKEKHPENVLIASLMAEVIKEDWQELAKAVVEAGADAIELNLSCPHGMPEKGMGSALGQNPELVRKITGWVKEVSNVPVLVKLTPNITDIRVPARAALEAGADAITAINTVAGLMCVDIEGVKPVPTVGGQGTYGGYSGTGVKPIGLRAVAEISRETGLPVSGMGGITTWEHAVEYLLVGSTTLQVCTLVMFEGYDVVEDLKHGLKTYMHEHGLSSLHEIIGKALPALTSHEKLPRQPKMVSCINLDTCLGCGKCHVACRDGGYSAISFGDDRRPVVDEEMCDGCSLCTHVCPVWGCVTMKEAAAKPEQSFTDNKSNFKILKKRMGE